MPDIILSDYLCGNKTTQFSFFRVPSQLVSHPRFMSLSADAKLLYGMLLNRMSLSAKTAGMTMLGGFISTTPYRKCVKSSAVAETRPCACWRNWIPARALV